MIFWYHLVLFCYTLLNLSTSILRILIASDDGDGTLRLGSPWMLSHFIVCVNSWFTLSTMRESDKSTEDQISKTCRAGFCICTFVCMIWSFQRNYCQGYHPKSNQTFQYLAYVGNFYVALFLTIVLYDNSLRKVIFYPLHVENFSRKRKLLPTFLQFSTMALS